MNYQSKNSTEIISLLKLIQVSNNYAFRKIIKTWLQYHKNKADRPKSILPIA